MDATGKAGNVEGATGQFLYPMWVMPMQALLTLSALLPHQQLKKVDAIVPLAEGAIAVFVSHQWLGLDMPDPEMKQLRTLQQALRNIFSGAVVVESDFLHVCTSMSRATLTRKQRSELQEAFVWYDWISCPQISGRSMSKGAVTADLQAAVDSIPAYVRASSYFVILAPGVPHTDLSGQDCDYESWRTRGWCRTELWAWALAAEQKPPVILIQGPTHVHFMGLLGWIYDAPGLGVFTVEEDRRSIEGVMQDVLAWKLNALRAVEDTNHWRLLLALRRRLLRGLTLVVPQYDCLQTFLRDFAFGDAADVSLADAGSGWTALHFAAIAGGKVVEELVALQCDINAKTHSTIALAQTAFPGGCIPLQLAASFGCEKTMEVLLRLRADACQTGAVGTSCLHALLVNNEVSVEAVQSLLLSRVDINVLDTMGGTPLHATACMGKPPGLATLLDLRADAKITALQGTALDVACFYGKVENARLLIQRGSDVNATNDTRGTMFWALCMFARGMSLFADSVILDVVAISDGATPLMWACLGGRLNTVRLLLASRADVGRRNSQGRSAGDIAAIHGQMEILQLIQEAAASHCRPVLRCRTQSAASWTFSCGECTSPARGDGEGSDSAATKSFGMEFYRNPDETEVVSSKLRRRMSL